MRWNAMLMAMSVAASNPPLSVGREDAEELTSEDLVAIRSVVRRQLMALKHDDPQGAWDACSPEIQDTFHTAAELSRTLRRNYPALLDTWHVTFGEVHITPVGLGMLLDLLDGEGERHHAVYIVARQADGGWRVHGCVMIEGDVEVPGIAA